MNDNKKRLNPVTNGVVGPKTLGEKFSETFLANDLKDVRTYMFNASIRLLRDYAVGLLFDGLNYMFYDKKGAGFRPGMNQGTGGAFIGNNRTPYNYGASYLQNQQAAPQKFTYRDVKFSDRGQAELVLSTLRDALVAYPKGVTIGDFYDVSNLDKTAESSDYDWGWTDLTSAVVRPAGGYFVIDFPTPVPLTKH